MYRHITVMQTVERFLNTISSLLLAFSINDNGEDSPRVIGEVAGGTETASEGGSSAEGNDTPGSPSSDSESDSELSGANPLAIIAGVAALAGVGGAAYYFTKKRK